MGGGGVEYRKWYLNIRNNCSNIFVLGDPASVALGDHFSVRAQTYPYTGTVLDQLELWKVQFGGFYELF